MRGAVLGINITAQNMRNKLRLRWNRWRQWKTSGIIAALSVGLKLGTLLSCARNVTVRRWLRKGESQIDRLHHAVVVGSVCGAVDFDSMHHKPSGDNMTVFRVIARLIGISAGVMLFVGLFTWNIAVVLSALWNLVHGYAWSLVGDMWEEVEELRRRHG